MNGSGLTLPAGRPQLRGMGFSPDGAGQGHEAVVRAVREAAVAVHRSLSPALPQAAYREALAIELAARGVAVRSGELIPIHYKGVRLTAHYRVDFVCQRTLLVLLRHPGTPEEPWLGHCLEASGALGALVIGFGGPSLRVWEHPREVRLRMVAERS